MNSDLAFPYLGEILALICAVFWAIAVILFKKSGEKTPPFSLNLYKNIIGTVLFLITFLVLDETLLLSVPVKEYIMLAISGIIGIYLADTLFLKSLNMLGAGLLAIVDCLYTPLVIILSYIFLKESLTLLQIIGAMLIIGALLESALYLPKYRIPKKDLITGMSLGALAMLLMAISIVMIKPILNHSLIMWVTEIRLLSASVFMTIIAILHPNRKEIFKPFRPSADWKYLLPGAIMGTYLSMITWIAGLKFTLTGIATAINQTSVIFIFIFAALFLKEKITFRRLLGIIIAFSGVLLITFS
ncbi:MAG: DMT family transporter [Candidatus Cloacimonadia bacterium]